MRLDVRKPLKKKKITKRNGDEVVISCKYERLGDFCFTCGIMSHTEKYYNKFLNRGNDDAIKEWGSWLRAPPRRVAGTVKSKWLREDCDTDWEARQGRFKINVKLGDGSYDNAGYQEIQRRDSSKQGVLGGT